MHRIGRPETSGGFIASHLTTKFTTFFYEIKLYEQAQLAWYFHVNRHAIS